MSQRTLTRFQYKIKEAIGKMVIKKERRYTQIDYCNDISIRVCSEQKGIGYFKFGVIVPNEYNCLSFDKTRLPNDFIDELENVLEMETKNFDFNLSFYLKDETDEGNTIFYSPPMKINEDSSIKRV